MQVAATAALAVMQADIFTPDPSDAVVYKWVGYAIIGGAAATYLYFDPPALNMSLLKNGLKGGSQKQRDKWYGNYPSDFKKWAEHKWKEPSAPDLNREEQEEAYE